MSVRVVASHSGLALVPTRTVPGKPERRVTWVLMTAKENPRPLAAGLEWGSSVRGPSPGWEQAGGVMAHTQTHARTHARTDPRDYAHTEAKDCG